MSEATEPKTVEKTGTYVLADGTPVRLKEGDVLPEGAEFRDAKPLEGQPEERAKGPAPENRAQTAPPRKPEG